MKRTHRIPGIAMALLMTAAPVTAAPFLNLQAVAMSGGIDAYQAVDTTHAPVFHMGERSMQTLTLGGLAGLFAFRRRRSPPR